MARAEQTCMPASRIWNHPESGCPPLSPEHLALARVCDAATTTEVNNRARRAWTRES
jgi:hypothetical protein